MSIQLITSARVGDGAHVDARIVVGSGHQFNSLTAIPSGEVYEGLTVYDAANNALMVYVGADGTNTAGNWRPVSSGTIAGGVTSIAAEAHTAAVLDFVSALYGGSAGVFVDGAAGPGNTTGAEGLSIFQAFGSSSTTNLTVGDTYTTTAIYTLQYGGHDVEFPIGTVLTFVGGEVSIEHSSLTNSNFGDVQTPHGIHIIQGTDTPLSGRVSFSGGDNITLSEDDTNNTITITGSTRYSEDVDRFSYTTNVGSVGPLLTLEGVTLGDTAASDAGAAAILVALGGNVGDTSHTTTRDIILDLRNGTANNQVTIPTGTTLTINVRSGLDFLAITPPTTAIRDALVTAFRAGTGIGTASEEVVQDVSLFRPSGSIDGTVDANGRLSFSVTESLSFGTGAGEVATWAEGNNTDQIPANKLENAPGGVDLTVDIDTVTNTFATGAYFLNSVRLDIQFTTAQSPVVTAADLYEIQITGPHAIPSNPNISGVFRFSGDAVTRGQTGMSLGEWMIDHTDDSFEHVGGSALMLFDQGGSGSGRTVNYLRQLTEVNQVAAGNNITLTNASNRLVIAAAGGVDFGTTAGDIAEWAEVGNTDNIPLDKLDNARAYDTDGVLVSDSMNATTFSVSSWDNAELATGELGITFGSNAGRSNFLNLLGRTGDASLFVTTRDHDVTVGSNTSSLPSGVSLVEGTSAGEVLITFPVVANANTFFNGVGMPTTEDLSLPYSGRVTQLSGGTNITISSTGEISASGSQATHVVLDTTTPRDVRPGNVVVYDDLFPGVEVTANVAGSQVLMGGARLDIRFTGASPGIGSLANQWFEVDFSAVLVPAAIQPTGFRYRSSGTILEVNFPAAPSPVIVPDPEETYQLTGTTSGGEVVTVQFPGSAVQMPVTTRQWRVASHGIIGDVFAGNVTTSVSLQEGQLAARYYFQGNNVTRATGTVTNDLWQIDADDLVGDLTFIQAGIEHTQVELNTAFVKEVSRVRDANTTDSDVVAPIITNGALSTLQMTTSTAHRIGTVGYHNVGGLSVIGGQPIAQEPIIGIVNDGDNHLQIERGLDNTASLFAAGQFESSGPTTLTDTPTRVTKNIITQDNDTSATWHGFYYGDRFEIWTTNNQAAGTHLLTQNYTG